MHIENVTPAPEGEMVLLIGQHMLTLDATIQDIDNVNIEGYFGDLPVDGETGELPHSLHFSAMNRIGMVIEVDCVPAGRLRAAAPVGMGEERERRMAAGGRVIGAARVRLAG